ASAFDPRACEHRRLLQPVIAAARRGQLPDRAPELADHHDQRGIELPTGLEIADECRVSVIKLLAHRIEIVAVEVLLAIVVLVHIPASKTDQYEARALIRREHLLGDQARIAETAAAVPLAIG